MNEYKFFIWIKKGSFLYYRTIFFSGETIVVKLLKLMFDNIISRHNLNYDKIRLIPQIRD